MHLSCTVMVCSPAAQCAACKAAAHAPPGENSGKPSAQQPSTVPLQAASAEPDRRNSAIASLMGLPAQGSSANSPSQLAPEDFGRSQQSGSSDEVRLKTSLSPGSC